MLQSYYIFHSLTKKWEKKNGVLQGNGGEAAAHGIAGAQGRAVLS